jgi:uncharacterized protein (TIGR02145 family)
MDFENAVCKGCGKFNHKGEMIMFCSNCGNKLKDSANFCSNCGTKVAGESVAKPEPEQEDDLSWLDSPGPGDVVYGTFTDPRDGKVYKTVKIGKQIWLAENLAYNAKGSKCYDNASANEKRYGRLYNWNAAMTACPAGWHLPSDEEWQELIDFRDDEETVGNYGFAALLGGHGYSYGDFVGNYGFAALLGGGGRSGGDFFGVGKVGFWWSATEYNAADAWNRGMDYDGDVYVNRDHVGKANFASVRCVQD